MIIIDTINDEKTFAQVYEQTLHDFMRDLKNDESILHSLLPGYMKSFYDGLKQGYLYLNYDGNDIRSGKSLLWNYAKLRYEAIMECARKVYQPVLKPKYTFYDETCFNTWDGPESFQIPSQLLDDMDKYYVIPKYSATRYVRYLTYKDLKDFDHIEYKVTTDKTTSIKNPDRNFYKNLEKKGHEWK